MKGRPASDIELAIAVGRVRRRLSVACVGANTNCLISRRCRSLVRQPSRLRAGDKARASRVKRDAGPEIGPH